MEVTKEVTKEVAMEDPWEPGSTLHLSQLRSLKAQRAPLLQGRQAGVKFPKAGHFRPSQDRHTSAHSNRHMRDRIEMILGVNMCEHVYIFDSPCVTLATTATLVAWYVNSALSASV